MIFRHDFNCNSGMRGFAFCSNKIFAASDNLHTHPKLMKMRKLRSTFGIATLRKPELVNSWPILPASEARVSEPVTKVAVRIDVGWGNAVYIRGQGASLNWDQGIPLKCEHGSSWVYISTQVKEKLVFKLLLNDAIWAKGEDISVKAGKMIEVAPVF